MESNISLNNYIVKWEVIKEKKILYLNDYKYSKVSLGNEEINYMLGGKCVKCIFVKRFCFNFKF